MKKRSAKKLIKLSTGVAKTKVHERTTTKQYIPPLSLEEARSSDLPFGFVMLASIVGMAVVIIVFLLKGLNNNG